MDTQISTTHPADTADVTQQHVATLRPRLTKAVTSTDLTLAQFDSLPNAAHVRLPVVKGLFGCSSATVWRRVKAREIPEPKKFGGRITAWNVGELRRTLNGAQSTA